MACEILSKQWVAETDAFGDPTGAGHWEVEYAYSDDTGDRRGGQRLDLPENSTDAKIKAAISKLYA